MYKLYVARSTDSFGLVSSGLNVSGWRVDSDCVRHAARAARMRGIQYQSRRQAVCPRVGLHRWFRPRAGA